MATVLHLHHINGEKPDEGVQCQNCGTWLGEERAIASSPTGPKFFCKQEHGDSVVDSCYLQWRRRQH